MFYRFLVGFVVLAGLFLGLSPVARADDPSVTIAAPDHEIGDLGAALGNTWTMDGTDDVVWTQPDASGRTVNYTLQFGIPGAYGQVLRGQTPQGSDLASAFYADTDTDLPSDVYRYLVYRSYIPPHQPGEGGIQLTNARVLYSSSWGSNWLFQAFPFRRYSLPQRICGHGQWCVYFLDLNENINGQGSPNPWDWGQATASVNAFGLWPHENWATGSEGSPSGDSPDYFYLDYLYLTGPIITTPPPESRYTVRWWVADRDGGQVTSTLYYQEKDELLLPAQSPACDASLTGWQPIPGGVVSVSLPQFPYTIFLPMILKGDTGSSSIFGSGQIGPYNQSFEWSLASEATYETGKVYYVCVEVEDAQGHKSYDASSAPVIKVPAKASLADG